MKIKYEQLFPTASFLNCRIGFEMDMPDDGNVDAELTTLKDLATAFHMKEFPQFYEKSKPIYNGEEMPAEIQVKKPSNKQEMISKMRLDILNCTTLSKETNGLLTFEAIVKSTPELQESYDLVYDQLTNKNN